jgi:hypothetical protein
VNPPINAQEESVEVPVSNTTRLALIDQKLDMVIRDHDKRLTSLEVWRDNRGKSIGAQVGTWVAVASLIVLIATLIAWK